jgi:hypothetical protein
MKIEKFNEKIASKDDKELSEFIELVINKFYPDDDLGNMGSYEAKLGISGVKKFIRSSFYFMAIDEDELKIMQSVSDYFKKFDSSAKIVIRSFSEDKDMVECLIDVNLLAYSKIFKDLIILKNTKKYNI